MGVVDENSSVGSVGDSYENALAESVVGLFQTEAIHRLGPWKSFEALEHKPFEWVDWFSHQSLLEPIKSLRDEGRTVVFVEHNMDVVQEISDWVVVMAEGRIIAQGTPAEIKSNKAVVDAYLGAHHGEDLSKVELA